MINNEVNIKITKQDKSLLDNLVRIMGRVKLELEGMEIIVAADSMRWLAKFQKQVEAEDSKPPMQILDQEPIKQENSETEKKVTKKGKKAE
jgi:hypothetical protein